MELGSLHSCWEIAPQFWAKQKVNLSLVLQMLGAPFLFLSYQGMHFIEWNWNAGLELIFSTHILCPWNCWLFPFGDWLQRWQECLQSWLRILSFLFWHNSIIGLVTCSPEVTKQDNTCAIIYFNSIQLFYRPRKLLNIGGICNGDKNLSYSWATKVALESNQTSVINSLLIGPRS